MNMEFRKATLNDDLAKISELLYYTDDYIYPYWFETVDNCREKLPALLIQDKFFFYVDHLYLALLGSDVIGLINIVDKKTDLSYDYNELKKVNERYEFTIDNYIMGLIDEVKDAEFAYISNICVDPNYRDLHVGTFLLENMIQEYKKKMYDEIALDVLAENPRAIHLYEKMGFAKSSDIFPGFNDPEKEKPEVFSMTNKI